MVVVADMDSVPRTKKIILALVVKGWQVEM